MDDANNIKVSANNTIMSALKVIDSGHLRMAMVVDADEVLIGTLSDGDIRRALLGGATLADKVGEFCNKDFVFSLIDPIDPDTYAAAKKIDASIVPVVNTRGQLQGIVKVDQPKTAAKREEAVVLMLGGMGSRLRPLTLDTPKPLLPVGGVPIAEIILNQLISHGFCNFIFSVNYKGEQIRDYFGNGSAHNVEISYIQERKRMGTAGSLGLIENIGRSKLVVMNGDLLSKIHYGELLRFVDGLGADGAVCVRPYDYTVPYGVVRARDQQVLVIDEKPTETFFVNAGIYVLSPRHIDKIPKNTFYDMPDLINKLVEDGENIASFPVHEYWLDIGEQSQYERAQADFQYYFSDFGLKCE